ncbi:hypothetical protein CDL15_Pgr012467 [Punica granatum]|uniref:Uncharacterized protein n=1 Tax=Punica granatum TaxID=22663 RepID=A0A218WY08_PUNGR|nr:hypothetical protein CDL15_Pgr012467 [Punica granatum]
MASKTKSASTVSEEESFDSVDGLSGVPPLREGSKIDGVIISEDNYKPVGPAEKIFKMELGIITRLLAPLRVFYWKRMKNEMKEPLFARLESEFQISLSEPYAREVVDAAMADRYRPFKHNCCKHYRKFSTIEEARQNPPIDVEEADWIPLCEHFESDEFKEQMKALHAQPTENDIPLTGREIFQEVVKPKSGYTRGLGYGARHHARPRSTARFYVEDESAFGQWEAHGSSRKWFRKIISIF